MKMDNELRQIVMPELLETSYIARQRLVVEKCKDIFAKFDTLTCFEKYGRINTEIDVIRILEAKRDAVLKTLGELFDQGILNKQQEKLITEQVTINIKKLIDETKDYVAKKMLSNAESLARQSDVVEVQKEIGKEMEAEKETEKQKQVEVERQIFEENMWLLRSISHGKLICLIFFNPDLTENGVQKFGIRAYPLSAKLKGKRVNFQFSHHILLSENFATSYTSQEVSLNPHEKNAVYVLNVYNPPTYQMMLITAKEAAELRDVGRSKFQDMDRNCFRVHLRG